MKNIFKSDPGGVDPSGIVLYSFLSLHHFRRSSFIKCYLLHQIFGEIWSCLHPSIDSSSECRIPLTYILLWKAYSILLQIIGKTQGCRDSGRGDKTGYQTTPRNMEGFTVGLRLPFWNIDRQNLGWCLFWPNRHIYALYFYWSHDNIHIVL